MNRIERRLKLVELKTNREYWVDKESEAYCDAINADPYQQDTRKEANKRRKKASTIILEINTLIKKLESEKK